jgi:putative ABC transport system substrate-binding protein
MNRRRGIVAAALATLAMPRAVSAQPVARKARIGFLSAGIGPTDPGILRDIVDPFRQGLRELGYIEGQNINVDYRWAEGKLDRLPGLLAELLALQPDALFALGPGPARLVRDAQLAIPVVAVVDNPVEEGLASSLARPGGNFTGLAGSVGPEMLVKRLQALKEIVPSARHFGILLNPNTAPRLPAELVGTLEKALDGTLRLYEARAAPEFEAIFASMARDRIDAIVIFAEPTFYAERTKLQALCTRYRLPSAWGGRNFIEPGGLLSFQSDFAALFKRSAAFVDKILKGTRPGDIPFELPSKFQLIINLKTAKALGLTIPQSVLLRADEVIE